MSCPDVALLAVFSATVTHSVHLAAWQLRTSLHTPTSVCASLTRSALGEVRNDASRLSLESLRLFTVVSHSLAWVLVRGFGQRVAVSLRQSQPV